MLTGIWLIWIFYNLLLYLLCLFIFYSVFYFALLTVDMFWPLFIAKLF